MTRTCTEKENARQVVWDRWQAGGLARSRSWRRCQDSLSSSRWRWRGSLSRAGASGPTLVC